MYRHRFSGLRALFVIVALVPSLAPAGLIEGVSDVQTNIPVQFGGMNVNAFLGANRFYSAGYDGTGVNVANIEGGHIWNGHQDLDAPGQVRYIPAAPNTVAATSGINAAVDRHATWVASHIAGRGDLGVAAQPYRYGIAHGATLYSGTVASSFGSPPYSTSFSLFFSDVANVYGRALNGSNGGVDGTGLAADVINSSWGFNGAAGTRADAIGVDMQIDQSAGIAVFSAGNSGPGGNTVSGIGAGYNAITVGALGNANTYDAAASFSSRGPNDWFNAATNTTVAGARARVDISAPGQNLTAAYYGGATGGNTGGVADGGPNFYTFSVQGTSFAAPIVAGGAALLVDAGNTIYGAGSTASDGRVVKAVLMNSADKTTGWSNGQTTVNVGGDPRLQTTQSLDYATGAGRMNLDRAFDQFVNPANGGQAGTADLAGNLGGLVDNVGWDLGTVAEGLSNLYFITDQLLVGTDFTSTLTWFVERTANATTFGSAQEVHFANLNLRVFRFDDLINQTILDIVAESISIANTSEHLFFSVPTTGFYGIEVNYLGDNWDFAAGGRTSETYGLAWSSTVNPAAVPEPSSFLLLLLVAGPAALVARRRKKMDPSTTDATLAA